MNVHITQEIFSETSAIPVPCNMNFTPLDVAHSMDKTLSIHLRACLSFLLHHLRLFKQLSHSLLMWTPYIWLRLCHPNMNFWTLYTTSKRSYWISKGRYLVSRGRYQISSMILELNLNELEAKVTQTCLDVVPLNDVIYLQFMMDVWLHENGFGPSSILYKSWISCNKK